jgi:hypothetical protein
VGLADRAVTGPSHQILHIARRRAELPVTVAALDAGELSVDQAAVVARHTPPAFESAVPGFARHATVVSCGGR